jgi:hypothetical protein
VPRVRVDILLEAASLEQVRHALGSSSCGLAGQCRYWVTPVSETGGLL